MERPTVAVQGAPARKFNAALPRRLAELTLANRLADLEGAASVLREPATFLQRG